MSHPSTDHVPFVPYVPKEPVPSLLSPALEEAIMKVFETVGEDGIYIKVLLNTMNFHNKPAEMYPHLIQLQLKGLITRASDGVRWVKCAMKRDMVSGKFVMFFGNFLQNCSSNVFNCLHDDRWQ